MQTRVRTSSVDVLELGSLNKGECWRHHIVSHCSRVYSGVILFDIGNV